MSNEPIFDFVKRSLSAAKGKFRAIAAESGVPYSTLVKIHQGVTENPGVQHVQALADYFKSHPTPQVEIAEKLATEDHRTIGRRKQDPADLLESGRREPSPGDLRTLGRRNRETAAGRRVTNGDKLSGDGPA